jgi:hypothetical protein
MGLDITYIAGENKLSFRLPPSEIDILSFLRNTGFTDEVDAIFGVDDFGKTTQIDRITLLKSATHLVESIKTNPKILPYIYSSKEEISRGSGMYSSGTGIISGFRIGGILHCLEVGLEKCELRKRRQNESGKWEEYEPQDVRNLKVIKIDDDNFFGDITIYRKRKPTKLLRNLEQLRSFLSKSKVEIIEKILG